MNYVDPDWSVTLYAETLQFPRPPTSPSWSCSDADTSLPATPTSPIFSLKPVHPLRIAKRPCSAQTCRSPASSFSTVCGTDDEDENRRSDLGHATTDLPPPSAASLVRSQSSSHPSSYSQTHGRSTTCGRPSTADAGSCSSTHADPRYTRVQPLRVAKRTMLPSAFTRSPEEDVSQMHAASLIALTHAPPLPPSSCSSAAPGGVLKCVATPTSGSSRKFSSAQSAPIEADGEPRSSATISKKRNVSLDAVSRSPSLKGAVAHSSSPYAPISHTDAHNSALLAVHYTPSYDGHCLPLLVDASDELQMHSSPTEATTRRRNLTLLSPSGSAQAPTTPVKNVGTSSSSVRSGSSATAVRHSRTSIDTPSPRVPTSSPPPTTCDVNELDLIPASVSRRTNPPLPLVIDPTVPTQAPTPPDKVVGPTWYSFPFGFPSTTVKNRQSSTDTTPRPSPLAAPFPPPVPPPSKSATELPVKDIGCGVVVPPPSSYDTHCVPSESTRTTVRHLGASADDPFPSALKPSSPATISKDVDDRTTSFVPSYYASPSSQAPAHLLRRRPRITIPNPWIRVQRATSPSPPLPPTPPPSATVSGAQAQALAEEPDAEDGVDADVPPLFPLVAAPRPLSSDYESDFDTGSFALASPLVDGGFTLKGTETETEWSFLTPTPSMASVSAPIPSADTTRLYPNYRQTKTGPTPLRSRWSASTVSLSLSPASLSAPAPAPISAPAQSKTFTSLRRYMYHLPGPGPASATSAAGAVGGKDTAKPKYTLHKHKPFKPLPFSRTLNLKRLKGKPPLTVADVRVLQVGGG